MWSSLVSISRQNQKSKDRLLIKILKTFCSLIRFTIMNFKLQVRLRKQMISWMLSMKEILISLLSSIILKLLCLNQIMLKSSLTTSNSIIKTNHQLEKVRLKWRILWWTKAIFYMKLQDMERAIRKLITKLTCLRKKSSAYF